MFLPDYDEIKKCLSYERLRPYEDIALLSPELDIALYNNIQFQSSLLFLPLQYLEVCLRNKINEAMYHFYDSIKHKVTLPGSPEEWYSWMPSSESTIYNVQEAAKKAKREIRGRSLKSDDIISHLNFGVWRHILQERADNKDPLHFWRGTVHQIFPNAKVKKEVILQTLTNITNTRNRLFHHEPLWKSHKHHDTMENAIEEIENKYTMITQFIGWMSAPLKDYMETYTRCFTAFQEVSKFMQCGLSEFIRDNPDLSFLQR